MYNNPAQGAPSWGNQAPPSGEMWGSQPNPTGSSQGGYGGHDPFEGGNLHMRHPHHGSTGVPQQMPQQSGAENTYGGIDPGMVNLAKAGFGAYGQQLYGKGHNLVSKYFPGKSVMYPYLNVSNMYVMSKLKLLLCPFLVRGDWYRQQGHGSGGYLPPRHDLHAPDLYLPLMGLFSYALLCSYAQVLGGTFTPEMLRTRVTTAFVVWGIAFAWLWGSLRSIGGGQGSIRSPTMDLVAYSGYMFVYLTFEVLLGILSSYAYYLSWIYFSVASGAFLVKTTKRLIYTEAQIQVDSHSVNYVLLCIAALQLPLGYFLGVLP